MMNQTKQTIDRLNSYIDLDKYPIHEPDSQATRQIVKRGHDRCAQTRSVCSKIFYGPMQ